MTAPPAPAPLAFVDLESTGLDPEYHTAWEIAVIRREPDGAEREHLWQIRLDPSEVVAADPEALRINRYYERALSIPAAAANLRPAGLPGTVWLPDGELEDQLTAALRGAVVIGSNPGFDLAFLADVLGTAPDTAPWHYRPVDIATLAAGYLHGLGMTNSQLTSTEYISLITPPYSSRGLSRAVGVEPPGGDVAHTALGDARWCLAVYDAVAGGLA